MSDTESVAKYIIRNTPNNYLEESLGYLKSLIGEQPLDTDTVKDEVRAYEEDHLDQLETEKGKVIMSSLIRDDDNYYHDQTKKIKYLYDPETHKITNIEETTEEDELQKCLNEELKKYLEKYFKEKITETNVYFDAANSKYIILISSHNFNKSSFWSGEWNSVWELEKDGKIKGKIYANTFYNESGSIHFSQKKEVCDTVAEAAAPDKAKAIVKIIETKENDVQNDLDDIYENFSETYIKPLRRALPGKLFILFF